MVISPAHVRPDTVPNSLGEGHHRQVEPGVACLVATDQENGLATRIEYIEDAERTPAALDAQLTQGVRLPLIWLEWGCLRAVPVCSSKSTTRVTDLRLRSSRSSLPFDELIGGHHIRRHDQIMIAETYAVNSISLALVLVVPPGDIWGYPRFPRSLFARPERDERPNTGTPTLRPRQRPYRLAARRAERPPTAGRRVRVFAHYLEPLGGAGRLTGLDRLGVGGRSHVGATCGRPTGTSRPPNLAVRRGCCPVRGGIAARRATRGRPHRGT